MTEAHDQTRTLHLVEHVPDHEARETDAHYHLFNEAKKRIKRQGLNVCAIAGCTYPGPMELHHRFVEHSLQGGVDIDKFNKLFGLHLDDEGFAQWIESPGNLEVLCPIHHRTRLGVHMIPGPEWEPLRMWKSDMAPPAEFVPANK